MGCEMLERMGGEDDRGRVMRQQALGEKARSPEKGCGVGGKEKPDWEREVVVVGVDS
jgi:hypothetical protein